MEQKTESLIELKARAYDASVQIRAWQAILDNITKEINGYVVPAGNENGIDKTDDVKK